MNLKIALLAGDGIGPEVIREAVKVSESIAKKFNHKIKHYIVDDMDQIKAKSAWDRESHQRNCIRRALNQLNIDDNDIILFSDVDEIPNPNRFIEITKTLVEKIN